MGIGTLPLREPGHGTNGVYSLKPTKLDERGRLDSNLFEKQLVILVDYKFKISEKNAMDARKTN